MADVQPASILSKKALIITAFFLLLGLTACNPSWVTDPAARYLKEKTGIEMKVEKFSAGIHPLSLEAQGIQLNFKKDSMAWDVKIPEMRVALGWSLSWEDLPWPKIQVEKIFINRPEVMIRIPKPLKEGDWAAWLKKCPALKQIEVNDLKGRMTIGKMDFQLAPGNRVLASFSPDQGGKIDYRLKGLQGGWTSKRIKFKTKSEGTVELSDLQDQPKWKGNLSVSDGNLLFKTGKVGQVSGTFGFLYQDHIFEISASSARVREIDLEKNSASFSGRGNFALSGTLRIKGLDKEAAIFSGIHAKFDEWDFDFNQKNRTIKGRAEGQARLSGPFLRPILKASISTRQTEMDLPPVFTRGMETDIEVQGKIPVLSFPVVRARAAQIDWHLAPGPLSVINPETRFSAQMKTDSRQIFLNNINLKSENWTPLSGSLLFDLTKGPAPQGKARSENFPLLKFLKHFFPKVVIPFPEEIPCQGFIEWSREATTSPFDFLISIAPLPFAFEIPDTDWEGEDLRAQIHGKGKWFFKDKKTQLILDHTFSGGSISRSPWIFDLDRNPLKGRFEGTIDGRKQTGSLKGSLGLQYDPLGELVVSGEWPFGSSPSSYSGSIEVKNLPLEKGFPLLVGMPLSEDHPFWERVSLQGLLNARLSILKEEKTYDLKGRILGSGIDFTIPDSAFSFQKGSLDLPLHVSSPNYHQGKELFAESGFIQVENLQGPRMDLNKLRFPVLAGTNRFEIPDKVAIPLRGGQMSMNSFKLSNPLGDLKIETAIVLKDLDLLQLFTDKGIAGTLNGDLGPIRIDKEKAVIEGILKADVFEGSVEGKNLVIVQPFSSERSIQGDLFFTHLNLEPITRRFSFGTITGFVQGHVMELAVRNNLPEHFHLLVKTQEIPGVSKSIHIKAIENIGLLGTGWGDFLRQGINRWISVYDYREIGLACSLHEDLFNLRGTIIEEGIEYLMRKPNVFGIDIINKNPDNEILFSDILERIRSIRKKPQKGTGDENK